VREAPARRESAGTYRPLGGELAHHFVDQPPVGLALELLGGQGHHLAEVATLGGDDRLDGGLDLFTRELARQIRFDDGQLGALLLDQIGPVGLLGEL
jgi:hypothetical protein